MRILVTGGRGFIGRNLVEHLSQTHEVLAPTHVELDLADSDALDAWFARHEVDVVVHGAVRPGHRNALDPSRQLWTNLRMFYGLMRNAHRFGRLVFLSSGAVYDVARPLDHVAEEHLGTSLPSDEHGLSKYTIARYLEQVHRTGDADVVELRLFGVFGRYEDYAIRFVSNAICKSLLDLPITLRQNRTLQLPLCERPGADRRAVPCKPPCRGGLQRRAGLDGRPVRPCRAESGPGPGRTCRSLSARREAAYPTARVTSDSGGSSRT